MNPVLVTGKGRSGTTWLARSIRGDDRYVFEPFHPYWNPFAASWFDKNPRACMRNLMAGALGRGIDGTRADPNPAALVIKEIRRLEWLPLIAEWCPELRIVWITRDEAARRASMRRAGWDEDDPYVLYSALDFAVPSRALVVEYEALDLPLFVDLMARLGRSLTAANIQRFSERSPTTREGG